MYRIIDSAILLAILILVSLLGTMLPNLIGGSISLIMVLPGIYYVSYFQKTYQIEMTYISTVLVIIIGVNLLNYVDIYEEYQKSTLTIFYIALLVLTLFTVCLMLINQLSTSNYFDISEKKALLTQNYKLIVINYTLLSGLYAMSICLAFNSSQDFNSVKNNILKMIPISYLCIPASLFALKAALKRLDDKYQLKTILKTKELDSLDKIKLKTQYIIFMLILFVIGTIVELVRKEWLMWIGSFITFNIAALLALYVLKLRATQHEKSSDHVNVTIDKLTSPRHLIKIVTFNTIGIFFVTLGLIALIVLLS
jgi:hypothetical protein